MGAGVPVGDVGGQAVGEGLLGREVDDTQALALEDGEPLLTEPNLAHVLSIVRKPPRVAETCLPCDLPGRLWA